MCSSKVDETHYSKPIQVIKMGLHSDKLIIASWKISTIFLLKTVIIQLAMLVYQRVYSKP